MLQVLVFPWYVEMTSGNQWLDQRCQMEFPMPNGRDLKFAAGAPAARSCPVPGFTHILCECSGLRFVRLADLRASGQAFAILEWLNCPLHCNSLPLRASAHSTLYSPFHGRVAMLNYIAKPNASKAESTGFSHPKMAKFVRVA